MEWIIIKDSQIKIKDNRKKIIEKGMETRFVTILMSTYNGAKYLKEQIDSLISQDIDKLHILIRDDGSTDGTKSILDYYASIYENIEILYGENCGAEESFNQLCNYALNNIDSNYYAFCDQDDIWEASKLSCAIKYLSAFDNSLPNLYFSNLTMVDENLNYIREMYKDGEVVISKKMALLQIFTYGCTCVFNKRALQLYCRVAPNKIYHDNWVYVVCQLFGNVIYDNNSYIKYRQHSSNLSEHKSSGPRLFISRLKRLTSSNLGNKFETISRQLLDFYSDLPMDEDLANLVKLISAYRNRVSYKIKLLLSPNYKTTSIVKNGCIMGRILINHL